jgi:cellulose synthase/poly-beta-1,6-N-acetylglucosamine synthase-like glycosyltransferase
MEALSIALSLTLTVLVAALAAMSAAAFGAVIKGCFELRRKLRSPSQDFSSVILKSPIVPGVSVVLAPSDDSPDTRALVRRLLDLHFGRHELVLVLDGPSQVELDRWTQELHLTRQERVVPQDLAAAAIRECYVSSDPVRLLVVDKEPGGMADALNAGVNAAQYPVIGLVDREAEFIPELLLRLIRPMLEDWDGTVAVCGMSPPPPKPGLAGCIGAIESLRLWLARGAAFSGWNKLLPVPGACMLVKREAVYSVGGFRGGPLELFLDLYAATRAKTSAWRVALVAAPVSVRPAVGTWDDLRRQAQSDQQQLAAALGRLGEDSGHNFRGLFWMRALRPLLETAAYVLAGVGWVSGMVPAPLAALVLVTSIGGGIVISMAAVVLRELAGPSGLAPRRIGALFLAAIPENLGYRQIRNLWMIGGYFGGGTQKLSRGRAV